MAPSESGPWEDYGNKPAPSSGAQPAPLAQPSSESGPWDDYKGAGAKGSVATEKPGDFEGVDMMTQTLYDMAKTPQERKRALEHGYGMDSVKEDQHGLYVEKDGKKMKPSASGIGTKAGAFLMSEAAPTIGGIGGSVLGAAAGNVPGAFAGAGIGTAAGQGFNDMMLKVAGVYDRTGMEEAKELGKAGAFGVAGEGAGRIVGKAVGNVVESVGNARSMAKWAMGVDEDLLAQSKTLADMGINVPPEAYSKQSGMLPLIRKFAQRYGYDPVAKTATNYYEGKASNVLQQLGLPKDEIGTLTHPRSAVSYEETGEALIKKAQQKLMEDDATMDKAVADMRSVMGARMTTATEEHTAQVEQLTKAADAARKSAEAMIDHGWTQIDKTSDKMWAAAKLGGEPGNLAREYASRIWAMRQSVSRRARKMYSDAETVGAGQHVDTTRMQKTAQGFVDNLPEDLQKQYPGLVRIIGDLKNNAMTFSEAHQLRSIMRSMAGSGKLEPTMREGYFKRLSGELNAAIHSPKNSPKGQTAAKMLTQADDFYAKEMARFKDKEIKSLVDSVKAGLPPDPQVIAEKVLRGDYTERVGELKRLVGPQVWDAAVAADIKGMLKDSQGLVPNRYDDQAFVSQIINRIRSGTFDHYPPEIQKLLREHATKMSALAPGGKVEVSMLPDDDFRTFLTRANDMVDRIEALSKINPIETLQTEMKAAEQEFKATREATEKGRAADQLSFLTKPGALATESAKRIVKSPDLLRSALLRFDADGQEITLLRQTAARDMLTMGIEHGGDLMKRLIADGMTPEVQKRLFPNGLDKDVLELAENMKLLFPKSSDIGSSFAATSALTHPESVVPGPFKKYAKALPGPFRRIGVGMGLNAAATVVTNPRLVKWLAAGSKGTEAEREMVRQAILAITNTGGDVGAAVGAFAGEGLNEPSDPHLAKDNKAANDKSWRDHYQERYAR